MAGEVSGFSRHRPPYEMVTDQAIGPDQECCPVNYAAPDMAIWKCTRLVGHDGRHEAGGMAGRMYASWPR